MSDDKNAATLNSSWAKSNSSRAPSSPYLDTKASLTGKVVPLGIFCILGEEEDNRPVAVLH